MKSFPCASLLAVLAAGALAAGCGPSEDTVREEIEAARYCDVESDCENIGGQCPFGCFIVVNQAESERILDLLEDYENWHTEECMYDCMILVGIACEAGQCVALTE